jgi:hypothetical protein
MDKQDMLTVAEIGLRLADALHEISEEIRELRKEHSALRQQAERIQEAASANADRPPAQRPPSPVAALRRRYSVLFDAGEFRQAAEALLEETDR